MKTVKLTNKLKCEQFYTYNNLHSLVINTILPAVVICIHLSKQSIIHHNIDSYRCVPQFCKNPYSIVEREQRQRLMN